MKDLSQWTIFNMKADCTIGGRPCVVYANEQPQVLLIQPLGGHERATLDEELETVRKAARTPFVFVGVAVNDWEKELTPWHDPHLSERAEVGGHALDTLDYISVRLLPQLFECYGKLPVVLGGYSLAGLFARWAVTQADCFDAVAAASPSLWINSWRGFSEAHEVYAHYVCLSLGDREERTRNEAIAQVGNVVRWEYNHLLQTLGSNRCTLVWEQGGHFVTPHLRLARAFAWCMHQITSDS